MGKKAKTGKARKDKFYQLAKETGYRARSAFKLLQLNRKFQFLEKSRVCVDLCAAPGGWMQVAANHMPVQKFIIGVDLVPIKAIPDCVSFQGDITTEACRQKIKELLNDWRVDVFLHDGAPNVGMNWLHDAFQQAHLTLSALKLSTQFLKRGGWFVTKVFRSKDYHSLMWVFQQLFRKVHATKPLASRNESAEIFVVCQGFHAPDKLDPKFLDPKYVFKETDEDAVKSNSLNLIHPEKISKKAEGYPEGDYTMYRKLQASHFIGATNHLQLLAQASEIVIDSEDVLNHPKTTNEIKECCKDIKVLGKKEIRCLITWHKAMKKFLAELQEKRGEEPEEEEEEDMEEGEMSGSEEKVEESDAEEDDKELAEKLATLKEEELKEMKKKRKKVMKEKRKLRDKMSLNMVIPGDTIEQIDDVNIFNLKKIASGGALKKVEQSTMEDAVEEEDEEEDQEVKRLMVRYERHKEEEEGDAMGPETDDEEEEEMEFESDDEDDDTPAAPETTEGKAMNPLVVEMDDKKANSQLKAEMWFDKATDLLTEGAEKDDDDDDAEVKKPAQAKKQKAAAAAAAAASSDSDDDDDDDDDDESDDDDSEDDDSDDEEFFKKANAQANAQANAKATGKANGVVAEKEKDGFEVVPINHKPKKVRKLDPIDLAIGEEMIKSKKRRREIEEMSYHRYMFNDDNLPDWFAKDEHGHTKKPLPVSKDQIEYYRERQKAIDARPIKKIAEAKARKQRKVQKKLERARKKAEVISETVDTTDKEKWNKIKEVYKRAGLTKKKTENVSYVVAKRGAGKRVSRPAGVKGRFRVVDPRMKKDDRARKQSEKKSKGKKAKKGKSSSNRTKR